jgi:acyl transferase domain-containing protein/ubiquinone/menaquinone biosynthesis C-methylase UbiE/acyl carrier protein
MTLHGDVATEGAGEGREPIAICGIGCRLPGGAADAESFWRLLRDGVDAIREIPADRWNVDTFYDPEPGTPGKTNAKLGGFVDRIDHFDAGFFEISPREAARMDPQQRLLLEVAWEALEDAGQVPTGFAGGDVGVFVGLSSMDFMLLAQGAGDLTEIDAHTNTGGAMSISANRLSYALDLRGPSMAVDTACSSSLVAVHLACQSIWQGVTPMALAGGVNILIKPEPYVGFSRLAMLSPDGRCKAFDAGANGFVRSEGAGLIVLKPWSLAIADGDPVYALIRATAINQDGRTNGLTVPSQKAQEELLREACRQAGVAPADVQFVEAHGTGTLVGDPIEARALGTVLAEGRPDGATCAIGSVKTNIGHLEPAAGIAGLLKVALALDHDVIPPNLHFREPNPEIPFDELKLRIPCAREPWSEANGPVIAGVNSFGFGGTNAHVVLERVPRLEHAPASRAPRESSDERPRLVALSAKTGAALSEQARRWADHLGPEGGGSALSLADVSHTSLLRRAQHDHRLAVAASTREELVEKLAAFAEGERRPGISSGRRVSGRTPSLVHVASGQGPQWWAMGRQLLETEPVFRATIERCDEIVRGLGPWSLLEELGRDEASSRMQETSIGQPSIFALQVALARLLEFHGVRANAFVGHSVGEVAAAHLAGALDLEDATRVIYHRGRCMDFAEAKGRMLAASLPFEEAEHLVAGAGPRVSLAANNSPGSVAFSGAAGELETLAAELEARGIYSKFLQVEYAFHSAQMDPMRESLLESLADVSPQTAERILVSSVTGERLDGSELDAEYWWSNVRQTVRFAKAVDTLLSEGHDTFLELAPHPVLSGYVGECAHARRADAVVLHTLKRGEDEQRTVTNALGALHARGVEIDTASLAEDGASFVRLPLYPWQRERFWHETRESEEFRTGPAPHPLLGRRTPASQPTWRARIDLRVERFLGDHRVQGHALLSGTSFLEMALAAARELHGPVPCVVEEVRLEKACFLEEEEARLIELVLDPTDSTFRILSSPACDEPTWTVHVRGKVRPLEDEAPAAFDPERRHELTESPVQADEAYARMAEAGLAYGPSYRGLHEVWIGPQEAVGRVEASPELEGTLADFRVHPGLLDSCFQVITGLLADSGDSEDGVYFPVEFESVRAHAPVGSKLWSHVTLVERTARELVVDVLVAEEEGRVVLEVRGFRCQLVDQAAGPAAEDTEDLVYEYRWRLEPRSSHAGATPRSAAHLTALETVAERTRSAAVELDAELGLVGLYRRLEGDLARLCTAFLWHAFEERGGLRQGRRYSIDELVGELGIDERYRRLLKRYLAVLVEDGVLTEVEGGWEVVRPLEAGDPESDWRELVTRNPAFYAELTLLGRCGPRLGEILAGGVDPLQLIFPDGSLAITEHLYQDSPSLRFYNTLAQRAVETLCEGLPEGRTLRILEIGAGTGGMTSYVLPRLPAGRTEYVYTDLSNHFFLKAEEKFQEFSFVEYKRLDIEVHPSEQEFEPNSFDLILASECLHATADLARTMEHVRWLLASEGSLLLLEAVKPLRWVDLVFGLTEGWWRFTDTGRRVDSPLLSMPAWRELLLEQGFSEVLEGSGLEDELIDNAVVLARGPRVEASARASTDADSNGSAGPGANGSAPGNWLVLCDQGGRGLDVAARLRAAGARCTLVHAGAGWAEPETDRFELVPGDRSHVDRLFAAIHERGLALRGIVCLWALDAPQPAETTNALLDESMVHSGLAVVQLAQVLADLGVGEAPRLWLVSRTAQSVGDEPEATVPASACVWGLGRVIAGEVPKVRPSLVDLGAADDRELELLVRELLDDTEEDELALRGEARYVHRYVRSSELPARGTDDEVEAYRLEPSPARTFDRMTLRAVERVPPEAGQVELEVAVAGLNFADVMKALGLYPGLPDGPVSLGIECSGRVTAVGEGVEGLAVGDEVVAIAPFAFGSHARTEARFVARKPAHLSFEEAATLPIAYLTTWYAIEHLGRLQPGERILIHSATGGVGMAAIQLARRAGAEVLATAGTPEKRDFLRALGVQHVFDSRSLAFADGVMQATNGEGVDVVLNSLAGEAIGKGLSVLRDYGRFLEIGKRDIYADTRLGLRPFKRNLSFFAIDLDLAMRERTDMLAGFFREIVTEVERGTLCALPFRAFPAFNVVSAFRTMSQAKHIGKVLISMQQPSTTIVPPPAEELCFRPDASYLLTGGLGGFGCLVARWMVERGARHLVLVGRSGASTDEAQETVAGLRAAGASVEVVRADVADAGQMAAVLERVDRELPPLKGVIHAAMVLKDRLLQDLDQGRMHEVWSPKVNGAWNLHVLTRERDLDFFALFSSLSSVFGIGGQANYASANAFLDSLSYYRQSQGLPSVTISWGYLGDVGWVARNEDIGARLRALGVKSFTPRQALTLFDRFLREEPPHVGVMSIDWRTWGEVASAVRVSPRFADLVLASSQGLEEGRKRSGAAIRNELLAAPPEERLGLMETIVREQVARVLGASPAKLEADKPLTELGLDSLMAVELRNWIEGELRLSLPTVELMRGPTVVRLAELLLEQIESPGAKPSSTEEPVVAATTAPAQVEATGEEAEELLERVDELSDEEVDSLLERMAPQDSTS